MTLCVPNPPLPFGRHGDVCGCGYSLRRMLKFRCTSNSVISKTYNRSLLIVFDKYMSVFVLR